MKLMRVHFIIKLLAQKQTCIEMMICCACPYSRVSLLSKRYLKVMSLDVF